MVRFRTQSAFWYFTPTEAVHQLYFSVGRLLNVIPATARKSAASFAVLAIVLNPSIACKTSVNCSP